MTTSLNMVRDMNGFNTFGLQFSDTGFQTTLAANVAQSFTVPTISNVGQGNYLAIFSFDPGLRIFVARNATAVVPGGSFSSTVSELNPTSRFVIVGDVISFITPDTTAYVNVKLYAIQ